MYKIVGYTKNSGVIKENNIEWVNYTLHCVYTPPFETKNLVGCRVQEVKIPNKVFTYFTEEIGIENIIGCSVRFTMEERTYNGKSRIVVTDIEPI